ncbi:hypothetical protein HYPSUDRAFT_206260 [Hypholoma sublateritium FD-334 SS-4]|uniref:Uncharacterized protein n=1 Tax=Hypholoma sublateritium (strain FD-334 SS-4) TaxID=945553 RepID=A0A0D2NL41_HYPSF|nr:hypothetical protein HYPSUDRAFT_206260 [Hypholoma sublateritium FD-334 SS-4]
MSQTLSAGVPSPKSEYDHLYEWVNERLPWVLFQDAFVDPDTYDKSTPSVVLTRPTTPPGVIRTPEMPLPRLEFESLYVGNAKPMDNILHKAPPLIRFAMLRWLELHQPGRAQRLCYEYHQPSLPPLVETLEEPPQLRRKSTFKQLKKKISKVFRS